MSVGANSGANFCTEGLLSGSAESSSSARYVYFVDGTTFSRLGGNTTVAPTCYDLTYRSVQEHDKRLDAFLRNPSSLS